MHWRSLLSLSALLALVGTARPREDGPPPVVVQRPAEREVALAETFTGRTVAARSVDLRPRVSGYLKEAHFKNGAEVKKGDLLFEIEPRPYQAELNAAEANLKLAIADRGLQVLNAARAMRLIRSGAMGKAEYDQIMASRDKAMANVAAMEAAREKAAIYLGYTRVKAPITGRLTRRSVDPGNLVQADNTLLATIVSTKPIHAYFDVDERTVLRSRRLALAGKGPKGPLPAQVALADEEGFPHKGVLDFVDNVLNPSTGTVRARVVLPNADGLLLPGMFVRVRLALLPPRKALLVPESAVLSDRGKRYVLVVNDRNVLERRDLRLGASHEGQRVVEGGLGPRERVVVAPKALRPGLEVRPVAGPSPPGPARP
jgi:multidrug efflux system membrane fusion protein